MGDLAQMKRKVFLVPVHTVHEERGREGRVTQFDGEIVTDTEKERRVIQIMGK